MVLVNILKQSRYTYIMSASEIEIERLKSCLCQKFEVKDSGYLQYCIGIEFERTDNYLAISQRGYTDDLLEKFGMSHYNQVSTPLQLGINLTKDRGEDACPKNIPYQELIGGVMYLSMGTTPDITHAVSYLSQFSSC